MKSNTHSFSLLFMKYNGLMLFFIMLFFSCSKCSNTSTGGGSSGKTDSILPPNIVNINSTTLAPCTLDSDLDWEYVVTEKMGVSGMNPDSFIDYTSLRKFIFFDNWAPFIGYKTCFCGDFEEYEGYVFGFEKDWNFLIKPTDLYNKLMLDSAQIYRPVKRKSNGDIKHWYKNASNTGYLIEGELTPKLEKAMTWFALPSKKNQPTPDVRHKICVYGPWVSEKLHNYRPEIHPAELIWFQDSINFNIHYLIVAQDASNRFANPDRYKGNKAYPWKPWTQKPINGVFKIPFRVNIDNASHDTLFYNLDINTTSNTTAPPLAYSSAKNSTTHVLTFDSVYKIQVRTNDTTIGIQFVDVCKKADTPNIIHGYVQIALSVGKKDNEEGLYVIKLTQSNTAASDLFLTSDNTSLKKAKTQLKPQIQSFQQTILPPLFTLTIFPESTVKSNTDLSPITAQYFRKLHGWSDNIQLAITANKLIDFKIKPYYCPNEKGECEPEEGDDYQKNLNQWLGQNNIDTAKATIKWTFTGTNLLTNENAIVAVDNLSTQQGEITVSLKKVLIQNDALSITFPKVGTAIYRLSATATVRDNNDNTVQETFTFDSHSIEESSNTQIASSNLLEEMVKSLGFNYDSIFAPRWKARNLGATNPIYKAGSKERPDLTEIRYQMLFNYYQQMPLDGTISDDEIETLKNSIRRTQVRTPLIIPQKANDKGIKQKNFKKN